MEKKEKNIGAGVFNKTLYKVFKGDDSAQVFVLDSAMNSGIFNRFYPSDYN
jgi:hypothetical protein